MEMTHLVMPQDLNPFGNLFGGTMMGWMDVCAALEAFERTKHNCVTAHVSEIDFLNPVKLGDVVKLQGHYYERGNKSIKIRVSAHVYDAKNKSSYLVGRAMFTFVAIGEDGKSVKW